MPVTVPTRQEDLATSLGTLEGNDGNRGNIGNISTCGTRGSVDEEEGNDNIWWHISPKRTATAPLVLKETRWGLLQLVIESAQKFQNLLTQFLASTSFFV